MTRGEGEGNRVESSRAGGCDGARIRFETEQRSAPFFTAPVACRCSRCCIDGRSFNAASGLVEVADGGRSAGQWTVQGKGGQGS